MFDSRITPARPDLAALRLAGEVDAERYVEAVRYRVSEGATPLFGAPDEQGPRLTEALYGEEIDVYECKNGWAWGQLLQDGYVGWLRASALSKSQSQPASHMVSALCSHCYAQAGTKALILHHLPFASRLALAPGRGRWRRLLSEEAWVYAMHIRPLAESAEDFVTVAESFIGAPYLWGGRQVTGLDCSALVQLSLAAAGKQAPRDSDMQEAQLGKPISSSGLPENAKLRRGDLVFWPGHVGIMSDARTLLHANAWHMAVAREPLLEAVERIAAIEAPVSSVRRLA